MKEYYSSKSGKKFNIKMIILTGMAAIIMLHLLSSLPGLYRSYRSFQQANHIFFFNDVSDDLFTAVGNYGFERGRVNVVLNDAGPVQKMESNRRFILDRRKEGDLALSKGLAKLNNSESPVIREKMAGLITIKKTIVELRHQTDKDLVEARDSRESGLAEKWFAAMTNYIESIESLLVTISIDISDADGVISRYSSLKHETLALRNTAGPEMSILSATILSREPIKPKLAEKIESLHVITKHHFQKISFLSQGFSSNTIPKALEKLQQVYFADYTPYREKIFPIAQTGGTYPISQMEFLDHGVKALKEIANFMSVVVSETKGYATKRYHQSRQQIILHTLASAGSLIAVILIIFYLNFKVIRPVQRLTESVNKLSREELNIDVPFLLSQNEIGDMARALDIFKKNVIQRRKAEAEKETLIVELEEALSNVKQLSGLLPICANCKKIRDDQGYWKQLESYISDHSEVQFSHSICQECAEKLYPGMGIYDNKQNQE